MKKSQKTMTNGEMVLAMFPYALKNNVILSDSSMRDCLSISLGDYEMQVSYDWWYLPYREDTGENECKTEVQEAKEEDRATRESKDTD